MEVKILHQDQEIVIVDKDHGISVHNNEDPQNLLSILEKQLNLAKLYPVHRLDKETSGIQVLALNASAAQRYSEEFGKKTVRKQYIGILRGQLKVNKGVWAKPLTDKAEGRTKPEGASKDRVPCETAFRVLQGNSYFSLCEFDLKTGRQHQIRKHTALTNHPLVGDPRYGDPKYNKKIASLYNQDRMFLHCFGLEILGLRIHSPLPLSFGALGLKLPAQEPEGGKQ